MRLIKLGGSVITDKAKECTLRSDTLSRLVGEMKTAQDTVIIHGAGSFGHIKAKRWGVKEGIVPGAESTPEGKERILAASMVQADVRRLNLHVMDTLCAAGIPAASLPPAAMGTMEDGSLSKLDTHTFATALKNGFVPVSFGDVLPDSKKRFSICSGDEIMYRLAVDLGVEQAFFVCDVDGLYDRDPKSDPGAVLYPRISSKDIRSMAGAESILEKEGHDVTGAMWGKVKWAARMAEAGVPVHFINGTVPGRLDDALKGRKIIQTILEA